MMLLDWASLAYKRDSYLMPFALFVLVKYCSLGISKNVLR